MLYFQPPQERYLKSPSDLDGLLADQASGAAAEVVAVRLGQDFGVRDEHIKRLVQALGPQLRSIQLGSSDTGDGTWLTDTAVRAIIQHCDSDSLEQLYLESCTSITDKAFLAIVEALPNLRVLGVTGHDRSIGKLTKKALAPLIKSKAALPQLSELYLTDQAYDMDLAVERLLKARRHLKVQAGETDSDSMAWSCVLRQTGRGYGDGLYGRW